MLKELEYKAIYRNNRDKFDNDFMIPTYQRSTEFNRAAGYFSLGSLILSIDGIIKFIENDGHMKLVCNPSLSDKDIALISLGEDIDSEHVTRDLIRQLEIENTFSEEEISKLDIICNMIAEKRLQIKIAFMPQGVYHEKFGIFQDEYGNKVHYIGSANETVNAKLNNLESFTVNCSWYSERDGKLIEEQSEFFNNLWNDKIDGLCVIPFPNAVKENMFTLYKRKESLKQAIEHYYQLCIGSVKKKKILHEYQKEAIKQFLENGGRHFYEMATGTGKTFTSIKTIEKLIETLPDKHFMTMICVPQIELQTQWKDALEEEGFKNIFLLGGESKGTSRDWSKALDSYIVKKENVVCIAIYDTFFDKIYESCNSIKDLFIIVDEAHNISSTQYLKLPKQSKYRLGLSATIIRYNKAETQKIINFFTEGNVQPYTYDIKDAIDNGYLSHYNYYPIFVDLTNEEFEKYQKKTMSITYALNKEEIDFDEVSTLCQQRSLIVKQASNKKITLAELAHSKEYNFKNSVIYCGQGKDEGETIISSVTKILYDAGYSVSTFTSKTENRPAVLYEFSKGYYDTLVAIKCFDEGVDVPQLDKIYIMASDTSPRQTVQRRGRVLRICKETNKDKAYIYDMIVMPPDMISNEIGVKSLIVNELTRAKEYIRLADNKNEINESLNSIIRDYDITEKDFENERDIN